MIASLLARAEVLAVAEFRELLRALINIGNINSVAFIVLKAAAEEFCAANAAAAGSKETSIVLFCFCQAKQQKNKEEKKIPKKTMSTIDYRQW